MEINMTAVIITGIICVTLIILSHMGRKNNAKGGNHYISAPGEGDKNE